MSQAGYSEAIDGVDLQDWMISIANKKVMDELLCWAR